MYTSTQAHKFRSTEEQQYSSTQIFKFPSTQVQKNTSTQWPQVHKYTSTLQGIGAPVPSEARTGWNWFSSFWYGTRLPLGRRGATQKMNCSADPCSLFWYGTRLPLGQRGATMLSWAVYSLFCSSLSQRQSCPIPKWGAAQLCSPFQVLHLAVPEAVLSHTKVRSISSAGIS